MSEFLMQIIIDVAKEKVGRRKAGVFISASGKNIGKLSPANPKKV
jgi:hypothetical protein